MMPSIYDFLYEKNLNDLEIQSVDIDCYSDIVILKLYHKHLKISICDIEVAFLCKDQGGWYTRFNVNEFGLLAISPQARSTLRDKIEILFGDITEFLAGESTI